MAPLRDLAARLAPLSRPAVPPLAELQRLREQTLAVLRAFAAGGRPGGGPAPEPAQGRGQEPGQGAGRDRGAEFWKR